MRAHRVECKSCNGTGHSNNLKCLDCNGVGYIVNGVMWREPTGSKFHVLRAFDEWQHTGRITPDQRVVIDMSDINAELQR